jgi:hypothetical protein
MKPDNIDDIKLLPKIKKIMKPDNIDDVKLLPVTIPFNDIEFSVITFEHDVYRFGDDCRTKSRELLEGYGY